MDFDTKPKAESVRQMKAQKETSSENHSKSAISSIEIGQSVMVKVPEVRSNTNAEVWRDGVVTDKGMIYPNYGSKHPPYPYVKVKYIHTYYRKLKDKYDGLVWVGEDGEFYDKENEALFFSDGSIKSSLSEHDKLTVGSVWINRSCWGDVEDVCVTPDSEKKVFFTIVSTSKNSVKYKISYEGNTTPDKIHEETKEQFLQDCKQKH